MRSAFSLVELSIVLVILGLLTGGILAGQSLIHASELRSVTADFNRYRAATNTFRDKYFGLPGDITNATSIWSTVTTNGNGDGAIMTSVVAGDETMLFWQELALAGLIEGQYNGTPQTPAPQGKGTPGVNVPASKISGKGFMVNQYSGGSPYVGASFTGAAFAGNTFSFAGDYGNSLVFTAPANGTSAYNSGAADMAALIPQDAWNIDTKLDDGMPGSGSIMSNKGASAAPSACTNMAGVAVGSDSGAIYSMTDTQHDCVLFLTHAF